jgi:hypothetical protein
LVLEFQKPACAIIKHANPCGTAIGETLLEAYNRALSSDPKSAFGGIVALMGVSDAFGGPASGAIIPSLLPDHLLPAGNVVRGIVLKGCTIAGPGIAGVIVVSLGFRPRGLSLLL